VSHPWERPYGEGVAEAVATVACVLLLDGSFRTNAMPAAAGEVEKCCVLHLDFCRKARTAFLARYDRSILSGVEWRVGEEKREGKRAEASNGSAQFFMGAAVAQAGRGFFPVCGEGNTEVLLIAG
jgi:hypothetical protein